jgi:ATP-dependent DNA helicase PIF1
MPGNRNPGQAPVLFDENDFDSDLDLDIEDPAEKGVVEYPSLPSVKRTARPRAPTFDFPDSSEGTVRTAARQKPEPQSSQPIPWSSSPIAHLKTPTRPPVQATKRRTLPWLQNQTQSTAGLDSTIQDEGPEPDAELVRAKKRRSDEGHFTPLPKDTTRSAYPWNTTASAVKQQQKSLRETNKKLSMKANEGTEDEVKKAVSKIKKNTVHRIFLSEEQQHVLNLVVEYKKSVFFTGSAGRISLLGSLVVY